MVRGMEGWGKRLSEQDLRYEGCGNSDGLCDEGY